jgi:hypothetical protein
MTLRPPLHRHRVTLLPAPIIGNRNWRSNETSETCRSGTKYRSAAISVAPNQTASKCCPKAIEGECELNGHEFKPLQTKTGSKNRQVPNVARLESDLSGQ